MRKAFLGLGSNLGDRLENLRKAVRKLSAIDGVEIRKLSSVYETEPVGFRNQDFFLNMVLEISTKLDPHALLLKFKSIEIELGRKEDVRWGPRPIDIDILYYGSMVLESEELRIPHPEIGRRRFVLVPLCEIAPSSVTPKSGESMIQLLKRCRDRSRVALYSGPESIFNSSERREHVTA